MPQQVKSANLKELKFFAFFSLLGGVIGLIAFYPFSLVGLGFGVRGIILSRKSSSVNKYKIMSSVGILLGLITLIINH